LAIPAVGIIGNTGVGIIDARSIGWVLIGPVVGLFLGIVDNSFLPNSFKIKEPHRIQFTPFTSAPSARNMHVKSGLRFRCPRTLSVTLRPSRLPGCDGRFLPRSGFSDGRRTKNRDRNCPPDQRTSYIQLGRWPVDLQLIIFSTTFGWRCGLSPATQTSGDASYRDAVLEIARELQ